MNPVNYIYIPISIAIFVQLFIPYFKSLSIEDVFLSPPYFFNSLAFVAKYILLGYLLYESDKIKNRDIFIFTWISVFLNLAWSYFINRNNKYAIIFLFLSILFGYFIYNEIFLSSLVEDGRSLYLNLLSAYIIWIGFMITLVFQHEQIYGSKRIGKKKQKIIG